MLLTFKPDSIEKIRRGAKFQTIRKNAPRWNRWYMRRVQKGERPLLQVYEGSPRSGGRFVCETEVTLLYTTLGKYFCQQEASDDGFTSIGDLIFRLAYLHGMTPGEVLHNHWAVIQFDTGPFVGDP